MIECKKKSDDFDYSKMIVGIEPDVHHYNSLVNFYRKDTAKINETDSIYNRTDSIQNH
jgi:hypothetical protein